MTGVQTCALPISTPVAIKTGSGVQLALVTQGEMRLAGSVTSGEGVTLSYGQTLNGYAEYFDNLSGQLIARTASNLTAANVETLLTSLRSGSLPAGVSTLITGAGLPLGSTVSVTPVSGLVPFESLSAAAKSDVASYLGYATKTGGGYYDTVSGSFYTSLQPAANSDTRKRELAAAQGYTETATLVFFKAGAGAGRELVTSFDQGVSADYTNSLINWGTVAAPTDPNASFDSLTDAQKQTVARNLGYTVEPLYKYNRIVPVEGEKDNERSTFCAYYYDAGAVWGKDGDPGPNKKLSELTIVQKIDAVKYLGGFPEYDVREINWGILSQPDIDTVFERMSVAQCGDKPNVGADEAAA